VAGKHCHDLTGAVKVPEGYKKIVLVGNPNVGKSVFFNAFTGSYVEVSNFPGTTVDINYSRFGDAYLIDTPGVYGVSSFNDEERVARDIILKADQVINIVDALHLERDLFLTQQIIDMGIPMVVVLNMMDEAENNGLAIDIKKLATLLGVPVVGTVAVKGQGLQEVKNALPEAKAGNMDPWLKEQLDLLTEETRHQGDALMILEEDPDVTVYHGNAGIVGRREEIYLRRRRMVDQLITRVVTQKEEAKSFSTRLGQQLVRPVVGLPALLLFLVAMYYFIGVFIAQVVVDFTEEVLLTEYYGTFIENLVSRFISADTLLGNILIGEFGLLTMTVIYLFGLLLPLIIGFYLALSLMEDSGYLPRLATLVDRVLMGLGLNGRAVIPMILGFGCVTMATITTRLLGSRRERVIATVLLGITIPCSAQLGVIAALIAPLGIGYFFGYIAVILIVFVLLGTGLNRVLPGSSTDLLIDLPPLRLPLFKNVAKKRICAPAIL
jgi:ferrous iron transport protein B